MELKFDKLQATLEQALASGSDGAHARHDKLPPFLFAAEAALARPPPPEDFYLHRAETSNWSQVHVASNLARVAHLDSASHPPPSRAPTMDTGVTKKTTGTRLARGSTTTQQLDGVIVPERCLDDAPPLQRPDDPSRAMRILDFVGILVVSLNAVVIFLDLERQGHEIAGQLGIAADNHVWVPPMGAFIEVADHIFSSFYVVEMAIKVAVMGRSYFCHPMNILDTTVVVLYALELLVLLLGFSGVNLGRLARLFKVSKLFRLPRIARASSALCTLSRKLYCSLTALGAAAVLLMLIVFITGLAMAHIVGRYLLDDCSPNVPMCEWAYVHYGSATRASWTMFKVTLSGGWTNWAADLVEGISWWYTLFWGTYIIVVWFGVLRVITAMFVKQTMDDSAFDHESMIKDKMQQKSRYAAAMRKFFVAVDENRDGSINYHEFRSALETPKATAWLQALGIEGTEIDAMFNLLDDGDGFISFDEFLASAVRLRGWARASDQIAMLCNQRTMLGLLEQMACDLRGDLRGGATPAAASAIEAHSHAHTATSSRTFR